MDVPGTSTKSMTGTGTIARQGGTRIRSRAQSFSKVGRKHTNVGEFCTGMKGKKSCV